MKKIELLAPAGDKEAFIAAVQNGANAIYLGGTMFNARSFAKNFDNDVYWDALCGSDNQLRAGGTGTFEWGAVLSYF